MKSLHKDLMRFWRAGLCSWRLRRFLSFRRPGCSAAKFAFPLRWLVAVTVVFVRVLAEAPVLDGIFPCGGRPGTTNEYSVYGKHGTWPPSFWSDVPSLQIFPTTNIGKIRIEIPPSVPRCVAFIRSWNADGASEVRLFPVDDSAELVEKEPNSHRTNAQPVSVFPILIHGRLEKPGDTDVYRIPVPKGHWLEARLEAYQILSRLDSVLRLIDLGGTELAWNHDDITLDPRILWQSERDTEIGLQVFGFQYPADSDIRLYGSEAAVYRLHLRTGKTRPGPNESDVGYQGTESHPSRADSWRNLDGVLPKHGSTNRHSFEATTGDHFEFRFATASIRSPLDPGVMIVDDQGKERLRREDSVGLNDMKWDWTAERTGTHELQVRSVSRPRAGELGYRVSWRKRNPAYEATLGANSLVVTAGSTNELKVNIRRIAGHRGPVAVNVDGLPPDVWAMGGTAMASETEAAIVFQPASHHTGFSGPISVRASMVDQDETPVPFSLIGGSENNGVPGGYLKLLNESLGQIWLTVRTNPPPKPADGK